MNKFSLSLIAIFYVSIVSGEQFGVITEDGVRLRNSPVIENSNIIDVFNKGIELLILEKSKEKVIIGKDENYWYRVKINNLQEGWIFGKFVKEIVNYKPEEVKSKLFDSVFIGWLDSVDFESKKTKVISFYANNDLDNFQEINDQFIKKNKEKIHLNNVYGKISIETAKDIAKFVGWNIGEKIIVIINNNSYISNVVNGAILLSANAAEMLGCQIAVTDEMEKALVKTKERGFIILKPDYDLYKIIPINKKYKNEDDFYFEDYYFIKLFNISNESFKFYFYSAPASNGLVLEGNNLRIYGDFVSD